MFHWTKQSDFYVFHDECNETCDFEYISFSELHILFEIID
jgi:hypothetical protein